MKIQFRFKNSNIFWYTYVTMAERKCSVIPDNDIKFKVFSGKDFLIWSLIGKASKSLIMRYFPPIELLGFES